MWVRCAGVGSVCVFGLGVREWVRGVGVGVD